MKDNQVSFLKIGILAAISGTLFLVNGCQTSDSEDVKCEPFQRELLDLGFSGASKMPLHPHIKNRSREQKKLVEAMIEIGVAEGTTPYIEQIENWERWRGYANLAYYYAQQGNRTASEQMISKVQPALKMAEDIQRGRVVGSTQNPTIDSLTDWRYQAVLTRIFETTILNTHESREITVDEFGQVNTALLQMSLLSTHVDDLGKNMNILRKSAEDPNVEIVHLVLLNMAKLIDQHYSHVDVAAVIKNDVEPSVVKAKLPIFMQIDVWLHFIRVAINHQNSALADELLEKAHVLVETLNITPRVYIPESTKLIALRYDAGQKEAALNQLLSTYELYQKNRDFLVDIERAPLLCKIGEVYDHIGDREQALELFKLAIQEGQVNPNSRPRVEALSEICRTMALNKIKPDEPLWNALNEMESKLGDPW